LIFAQAIFNPKCDLNKFMAETFFDEEIAKQEQEMAAKETERAVADLRTSIGLDALSLANAEEQLTQLEKQLDAVNSEIKNAPDIKSSLLAMKNGDAINKQIGKVRAERGRLVWDIRAKHSMLSDLEDKSAEAGLDFANVSPKPFTKEEEKWFAQGDKATAKADEIIGDWVELFPFTPEEEAWFKEHGDTEVA
jgi:chromosome segregation ATPase